ncbi:MAG: sorting protein [Chthoniobacteraceae bacterium]|nr:sorting protein [Chthoniobacteraceae bacterium]
MLGAFAILTSSASFGSTLANGGFESGTSGWTEAGGSGLFSTVSSLPGFYQTINPPQSGAFGLLSNNGVDAESISQTFEITDNYLIFSYWFLTDEYNSGPDYNDSAHATLTIGEVTSFVLTLSRDQLQAGGEGALLDGAAFLDNSESGHDIGQSAWQTLSVNVSSFIGQPATLSFDLNNVNDSTSDIGVSQLAVDDVHFASVPEPASATVAFFLIGMAGIARLRRAGSVA